MPFSQTTSTHASACVLPMNDIMQLNAYINFRAKVITFLSVANTTRALLFLHVLSTIHWVFIPGCTRLWMRESMGETFVRYRCFSYSFLSYPLSSDTFFSAQLSQQRLNGMGYGVPPHMAVPDTTKRGNEERHRNHCFALTG